MRTKELSTRVLGLERRKHPDFDVNVADSIEGPDAITTATYTQHLVFYPKKLRIKNKQVCCYPLDCCFSANCGQRQMQRLEMLCPDWLFGSHHGASLCSPAISGSAAHTRAISSGFRGI